MREREHFSMTNRTSEMTWLVSPSVYEFVPMDRDKKCTKR